ncbi:hypothetical protein BG003_000129, partial [Podila horticola]
MSRSTAYSILVIMAVVALFLSTANALPLEKREEHAAGKCWGSVVGNVRYCPYETGTD